MHTESEWGCDWLLSALIPILWSLMQNFLRTLVSTVSERIVKEFLCHKNPPQTPTAFHPHLQKTGNGISHPVQSVCLFTRSHTHTQFPLGCSLTSQMTNPHTQCLARGLYLTSKLFLLRSEADLFYVGEGQAVLPPYTDWELQLWYSSSFIKGFSNECWGLLTQHKVYNHPKAKLQSPPWIQPGITTISQY